MSKRFPDILHEAKKALEFFNTLPPSDLAKDLVYHADDLVVALIRFESLAIDYNNSCQTGQDARANVIYDEIYSIMCEDLGYDELHVSDMIADIYDLTRIPDCY